MKKYLSKFLLVTGILACQFATEKAFSQATFGISGTVHNDLNGLVNLKVDGNGVDSGLINVLLVNDSTSKVVAKTVNTTAGAFSFTSLSPASYSIWITTSNATVGQAPPAVALPDNWVSTGEFLGTGNGNDGTIDGILHLDSVFASVSDAHLGIEQKPKTKVDTMGAYNGNPGGVNFVAIDNFAFGGHDYNGGHMDSIRITAFPTHTTTLQINGTNYSATTFPANGIRIKSDYNGVPAGTINLDPEDGIFMVKIPYTTLDNAHIEDATPGAVYVPFSVSDGSSAQELVNTLTGLGVTVLNPQINGTCPLTARGKFNFFGPNDLGIDSGIVLTSGRVVSNPPSVYGVNGSVNSFASTGFPSLGGGYAPGDPSLDSLLAKTGSSVTTNDACVLEFDFVPAGDTIKFDYVFGSEEYPEYDCSSYNDVFGFFINGPGYVGLNSIALVPGTTIPVAINSINNATNPGAACTSMGTGSPFSQYYVDNIANNGTQLTYDGYTTVLTAVAAVNPCDTYHLKLAIADGSDNAFDSGVFLKAGSLNSTGIVVQTFGGGGLETPFTNTVRGCPPGTVRISRNGGFSQPVTIPLQISGTAVNGVDYQAIPNSVTIPAGDSVVTIFVSGIPVFPPVGPKTCVISAISPYTCANGNPVILSSDTITILDSIYVNIKNPDTVICWGESVDLQVDADTVVDFHWTPVNGVSDTTAQNVTVTPDSSTLYRVSVSLPHSFGCPAASDTIKIDVKRQPQINLGADIFTCADTVQLDALTSPTNPDESFSWTPAANLNNANIRNPVASNAGGGTITYVVTVNPGAIGCDGKDSINVTILPDHINLLNGDTAACAGTNILLFVDGDSHFSYNWAPSIGIANDTMKNTSLIAQQSGLYTVTASYPTCPAMSDSMYLDVQPVPVVNVGADETICSYDTLQLYASVMPNYSQYSYEWSSVTGLNNPGIKNPVFRGSMSQTKTVKVSTPIGCVGKDSLFITVNPGDFLAVSPVDTGVCPPAMLQLNAMGGAEYHWQPSYGLSDSSIADPVAKPVTSTEYTLISKSLANCYDTATVFVKVYPGAVIDLPDSVQIWAGESYQIHPGGNALYFQWFPPSGLSADDVANPLASPDVRTRYFVTAKTENGCVVKDSIDVLVNKESVINAPNAFAPGKGINGIFKIEKRGFAKLNYFRIYNRWGIVVFETKDINSGWDGNYHGKPQPMGVYVYVIDATTQNGEPFKQTGNVTLIR